MVWCHAIFEQKNVLKFPRFKTQPILESSGLHEVPRTHLTLGFREVQLRKLVVRNPFLFFVGSDLGHHNGSVVCADFGCKAECFAPAEEQSASH